VSVSDKAVIWAGKFDERLTGIFEVEDSISERIAASLELELTVSERALLARRRTDNIDAYQAYLKGRFFLNKRTTRWIKRSVECFKEAARLDPAYAEAHAGLCDSYTLLVTWDALTPIDGLMKANSAAQHALEIDAGLAEAHAGLAHAMLHAWQFDDAEREFKRALDLNPGYAATYLWYAEYLAAAGRFEEAIDSIQRARQQDPLSSPINAEVGWVYYLARRYNEAAVELKRALDLDPDSFLGRFRLWHVYTQQGLREEAAEELGSAIALSGEGPLAGLHLGYASAASGNREQALKLLGELIGLWKQRYFSPYWIALIHTALEDIDSAFEWLERGYENRDARMILLRVDPVLDLIRGDQRFDSLLWRVGLSR
jgi:tetratricopeptide (TPR) repeat protein